MRDIDDEIDALLRTLDHPAPPVRVEDVIARAAARPRRRPAALVAAGILLVAGVAAAAVVPSTPLHRAIVHAVALVAGRDRPSTPQAAQPQARAPQGTTVAMVPRARLTVRFVAPPPGVRLRVRFAPVAQLSLVPEGGDAAFSVGADAIEVSRPTAPSFLLTVPSALQELRVERDGTPVFERRGDTIRTSAPRDAAGEYLLELDASPR